MVCGRLLGEGELVKGSVGWESRASPKGRYHFRSINRVYRKVKLDGRAGREGPASAGTRRVHPGVKEGDAGRKSGPLGTARGREEIGS